MKKMLFFLTSCCLCGGAFAEEVYKCEQDGKVTISTTPCPTGATVTVVPVEKLPPASESPEQELARMKQQADTLERERLEREAAASSTAAGDAAKNEEEAADGNEAAGDDGLSSGRFAARRKREQQAQEARRQRQIERREARREASSGGSVTPQ
ncbi:MAG: DUF4124 domain-containing protein [Zoogloeaceae bacterium]|jgi:hypothetical protein|nr:DUF4124 domain-containing protein [Zoogloeaceae bacterium]